jgi:two-component system phosphate regulon sensor histidine kinase PhoR
VAARQRSGLTGPRAEPGAAARQTHCMSDSITPVPREVAAVLGELADVVERANSGGDGLLGLHRIVELAQSSTGGIGALFLVYANEEARVVAAAGAGAWSLGRMIDVTEPAVASVIAGPPVQELSLRDFTPDTARHMRGQGARRTLRAAALANSALVGSLQIYFSDADGRADSFQLAVARLLAGCAARLCVSLVEAEGGNDCLQNSPASEGDSPARDLFAAVASHELRTPVTVIRGYADTLVDHWNSLDEPSRRKAVAVIGQRARDLARLVDRLLHTATDVAGMLDAGGRVPFDLAGGLRGWAAELTPELRRTLRVSVPDGLPKALGDRASLTTVLNELVTNGTKYSPERAEVEVTAGADEHTVWFRVADRGMGIPPEHSERAFERYWQLETGDQRRYGGVGLGLYLVRKILDRQHGWVSLRPRAGGGTVAEVRLPRADADPDVTEA